MTGITYDSGAFQNGSFNLVSYANGAAEFQGSPDPDGDYYDNFGSIIFDVTLSPAGNGGSVPEPQSFGLLGAGLAGLAAARLFRRA